MLLSSLMVITGFFRSQEEGNETMDMWFSPELPVMVECQAEATALSVNTVMICCYELDFLFRSVVEPGLLKTELKEKE